MRVDQKFKNSNHQMFIITSIKPNCVYAYDYYNNEILYFIKVNGQYITPDKIELGDPMEYTTCEYHKWFIITPTTFFIMNNEIYGINYINNEEYKLSEFDLDTLLLHYKLFPNHKSIIAPIIKEKHLKTIKLKYELSH